MRIFEVIHTKLHAMKQSTLCLLIALSSLFAACSSEQATQREAIATQEAAISETPAPADIEALIQLYEDYRGTYPEDEEWNARYAYREAALYYRMNAFAKASGVLQQALKDYPEASVNPQSIYMLGSIYKEKARDLETAFTVFQTLQQAYPEDSLATKAAEELPDGIPAADERLEAMRVAIYDDSTGRIDYRQANAYIKGVELYTIILAESEQAPQMLYKAGEIARSIRQYEKAIDLYEQLVTAYPEHEYAPRALFMQAFTLDDNLKQFEQARLKYEAFLARHPNDDFADDAQVLLDNLGKADEEIIETLTNKAQSETE
jgi:TolA-binding protein